MAVHDANPSVLGRLREAAHAGLWNAPASAFCAAMLKSELVARIAAQNPHLYEREVEAVVNAILDRIAGALAAGHRVELRGFGTFSTKIRAPRRARNPRTGATVPVEERSYIAFRPGREMARRLNDGSEAPAAGLPSAPVRRIA